MRVSDYNPFSAAVQADPYPYYAVLRDEAPVHFHEQLGWYILSRYEDVVAVTRNPSVFSSARTLVSPEKFAAAEQVAPQALRPIRRGVLANEDPPAHTKSRGLVSKAFTPKSTAEMEPRIRRLVRELIARLPRSGEFDLIRELAEPLPVIVIAEMLGVEPERRSDFKRWSDDAVATSYALSQGTDLSRLENSAREMNAYMAQALEARRREPRNDLTQALLDHGVREGVLSLEDASDFCRLLLVAGNETTTSLLGNGMRALLAHPEQMRLLTRDPTLIPNAVEEMLRYDSAAQALFRKTTREVELAGTRIPAGATLLALVGSANRDPRKFPEPDRFDVTRDLAGQIAFGHGIHFCLGAPLARMEARVVLEELLTADRQLSLVPGQTVTNKAHFIIRGITSLHLRTEPVPAS